MNTTAHTLAIYGREARAEVLTVLRTPQFLAPSVALPVMFYAMFAVGFAHGRVEPAQWLLATYAVFAAVAPAMFGFGAGVAAEREAKLLDLKRASPMPSGVYVAARLAAAMTTTAIAIALIFMVALFASVAMPLWRWAAIFALGVGSAVPFGLIGLNLGLRLGAQGASAAANLLFVAFCMLGGLWVPLSEMPPWMSTLAWAFPSYHLGALSLDIAGLTPATHLFAHVAIVCVIAILAAGGAWSGWRREDA
jgi:ABC-2 type transport system permease protein